MTMAKIDSGSRMRLPPDSALKPQPYSEREHAANASKQRTLTDWFQLAQQQRQGQTDPTLARAIESALKNQLDVSATQGLRVTVTIMGPSNTGVAGQYEARAGDQLLRIQSATPLQTGQTLLLTASPAGPTLVVPASAQQQAAVLSLVQQAQLARLPTLQAQTNVNPIQALLNAFSSLGPKEITAAPETIPKTAASAVSGSAPNHGQATSGTASTLPTPLISPAAEIKLLAANQPFFTALLTRWANSLPSLPTQAASALTPSAPPSVALSPSSLPTNATNLADPSPISSAVQQTQPTSPVTPTTTTSPGLANRNIGQHWISQLLHTAQQQYGAATAQSVRKVWQQWQQGAIQNLTSTPPTFTAIKGSATTQEQRPASSPGALNAHDTLKAVAPLPLLIMPKSADSTLKPLAPPGDWWRLAAEQWLDSRMQFLNNASTKPLSLEEQLRQQAQRILHQPGPIYSPEQLKRTLTTRRNSNHLPTGEQQMLTQIRQTLEQITQQQVARQLFTLATEASTEHARLIQSIPVWADQQLVWFDIERQPEPDSSSEDTNKSSQWCLDVHFHLPPMAPMCARMHWQGQHCAIQFLTDDTATLRVLHEHINSFQQRLQQMGLPVDEVLCRHGLPKRQLRAETASPGNHRVDIRT